MLTIGNRRTIKGDCVMKLENLLIHCEDMVLIAMAPAKEEFILRRMKQTAPASMLIGATMPRGVSDSRHLAGMTEQAALVGSPQRAPTNGPYETREPRPKQ